MRIDVNRLLVFAAILGKSALEAKYFDCVLPYGARTRGGQGISVNCDFIVIYVRISTLTIQQRKELY